MRSVVVVLPASMWAMIPMLRVLSRVYLRCMGRSLEPCGNLRPTAASENSIRSVARFAPLVPLLAGALLLIVAEFLTVREIRAVTVVPPGGTETGGALHGYALGIIGLAMLPMSYGAVVRAARPAAVALLVLS